MSGVKTGTGFPWPDLADGLNVLADEASDIANAYVDDTRDDKTQIISEASLFGAVLAVDAMQKRVQGAVAEMVRLSRIPADAAAALLEELGVTSGK
jgi:hypothetical protein